MPNSKQLLRRMLVLEALHKYIVSETARLKQQMRDQDVCVINRQDTQLDILFEYVADNNYQEAIYPRVLLDPEVISRARRMGLDV